MALTFADTHNMIAYLTKSDASEGFEQILDFLNASVIQYALTKNPTIYLSCIKQFWSFVLVKKVNDVIRLQALIDRRKVIITEDTVRQALHLDDAKSIDCLPNEEIFAELARMGGQPGMSSILPWLRLLSASQQLMISAQVGDLFSYTTKYTSPALTQKVFANMRRVGKGFSRVDTPLFKGMLVPQQAAGDVANVAADDVNDVDKIAQALEIIKLKQKVRRLEKKNKLKVSGLRRLKKVGTAQRVESSADTRQEESQAQVCHINLEHADKVLSMQDDEPEPTELKEVIEVVTIAKLMTKVVTAAATTNTAAPSAARRRKGVVIRDPEETTTPSITMHSEPKSKDKGKGIMVEETKPLMKQAQIEQDEAYTRELEVELNKNINWDDAIEQARENMMVYLKNMAGFKMDFFKGMSYDDIRPIFEKHFNSVVGFLEKSEKELEEKASRALKRKSKSSEQEVKKQKFDEEVEELKKHLHIVPNDKDDVYIEATLLALKPKNFSDDFLLTTLKAMFKKPDVEAYIWKNQKGINGLAKVKSLKLYPLTRFTLDQILNNVRLEVEEESEVSLELLRFENTLRDYYCWLKTYCCWYKLKMLDNAADSRRRLLEQSAATDDKIKK
nr:hypothetical protein [Tanacetum cinerariifolium]